MLRFVNHIHDNSLALLSSLLISITTISQHATQATPSHTAGTVPTAAPWALTALIPVRTAPSPLSPRVRAHRSRASNNLPYLCQQPPPGSLQQKDISYPTTLSPRYFLLFIALQQQHKGDSVSTEPLALCHRIWFANAAGTFKSKPAIDIFPPQYHTT